MKETTKNSLMNIGICLGFSLILSTIYIFYHISMKNITWIPLIISYIIFVLIVFLNVLVVADYFILEDVKIRKKTDESFLKFISYFYDYFNFVLIAISWVIFPLCINWLETGYYSTKKIILEPIHKLWREIKDYLKKGYIKAIIVIAVILGVVVVVLYFMFKDKYRLKYPWHYAHYFSMIPNIYSLLVIYVNVGYFCVQFIIDYKRQGLYCCDNSCCRGNSNLLRKYFFYSGRKIIKLIKEYKVKMQDAEKNLIAEMTKIPISTKSGFHDYLKGIINSILTSKKSLMLTEREEINNKEIIINNKANNNNEAIYSRNGCPTEVKIEINEIEAKDVDNSEVERKKEKENEKKNENEKEKEKAHENKENSLNTIEDTVAEYIRGCKESSRKITKLANLYKDILQDTKDELYELPSRDRCNRKQCLTMGKYIILFIVFIMIILSDICVPIVAYDNEVKKGENSTDIINDMSDTFTYSDGVINTKDDPEEEESSVAANIIEFIVIVWFFSAYTIMLFYTINRREYLSGDFLSGKSVNDNINLMKTLKEICGFTYPVIYCNFYFWKYISKSQMLFYENVAIPDYKFKSGITVFMIAKLFVIGVSIIIYYCGFNIGWILKNDLADFNITMCESYYNVEKDENDYKIFTSEINEEMKIIEPFYGF